MFFLWQCKKENDSPQWDVNILTPIAYTHLTFENIFADSNISVNPQGKVTLIFEDDFSVTNIDSLVDLLDTSVSNVFIAPISIQLNPGSTIPPISNTIKLGSGDIQLRNALLKKGKLAVQARNRLTNGITYTYTIPSATLNGVVFTKNIFVSAASNGVPAVTLDTFDLSGYFLNMTGNGTQFNRINYNLSGVTDPSGSSVLLFSGDTVLNVSSTFIDVLPYVVRGYFGTTSFSDNTGSENVGVFDIVQSGNIYLDEATLDITFRNYLGTELQANFNRLAGYNYLNGQQLLLQSPDLIGRTFNFNRSVETGNNSQPVQPFVTSVSLDNSNSNLKYFLENMPSYFDYGINGVFCPLGNISGSNDFIYSDYLLETNLKFTLPLKLAVSNLLLVDTVPFNFTDTTATENILSGNFKLIAENAFPLEFDVELQLLDSNNVLLETIIAPSTIAQANMDITTATVISPKSSVLNIPWYNTTNDHLKRATKIRISARINTYNQPNLVEFYSNYFLNLKLTGDFIYRIN